MKLSDGIRALDEVIEPKLRASHGNEKVDAALRAVGYDAGNSASPKHVDSIRKKVEAFKTLTDGGVAKSPLITVLPPATPTAETTPAQRNNPPMQNPQTPTTAGEPSTEALRALAEVLFGENEICRQMGASNRNDQRAALVKRFFIEGLEVPNLSFHGVRTHPSDMPKLSAAGRHRKIAQGMIAEFFAALDGNATFESQNRPATKKALALVHKQHGMKSSFYSGFIGLKPGQRYDHAKAEGTPVSEPKKIPKWEVGSSGPSLDVWKKEQQAKALREKLE